MSYQRPQFAILSSRLDEPRALFKWLPARAKSAKPPWCSKCARPADRLLLVGGDGIAVEDFLRQPIEHWLATIRSSLK